MKVIVRPRSVFESIKGTKIESYILNNFKIISINTPVYAPKGIEKELPPFSDINHKNLLVLYFHDYYKPLEDVILMNDEDALKIKNFIKDADKRIIVHCTAGISRSGAVGTFLSEYFNGKNSEEHSIFLKEHNFLRPNDWVYEKLKKAFTVK